MCSQREHEALLFEKSSLDLDALTCMRSQLWLALRQYRESDTKEVRARNLRIQLHADLWDKENVPRDAEIQQVGCRAAVGYAMGTCQTSHH